jgi:ABC-type polar amino acid transport system ATPase subunit
VITVRGLHKYYEGHHLFKGIDLDIEKGEVVVLSALRERQEHVPAVHQRARIFSAGEIVVDDVGLHSINRLRPARKTSKTYGR